MVLSHDNGQAQAAINLTKEAMRKIQEIHAQDPSKPMPTLTHTGHSLGGTLAQISAHYFNHQGVTFNAYGAASLPRIPEGGGRVVNYVKASDPVAAASGHYGSVVVLATPDEISRLSKVGYTNSRAANALLSSTVLGAADALPVYGAAALSVRSAHRIDNFTGSRSILSDPDARKLAQDNRVLIDAYRRDVNGERIGLNIMLNLPDPIWNINNTIDMLKPDCPAGEPAQKNLPPLTQSRPFSIDDLPPKAQNIRNRIEGHLTNYYEQNGLPVEQEKIHNAAMALTAACCEKKMNDAPLFAVKEGTFLVGEKNPFLVRASMDMEQATATPPEESINKIHETLQRLELESQNRRMQQSHGISMA